MRAEGIKLAYAHNAVVHHFHGPTIGSAREWAARPRLAVYLYERNRLLFSRERFSSLYPIVAIVSLGMIFRHLTHGSYRNFFVV